MSGGELRSFLTGDSLVIPAQFQVGRFVLCGDVRLVLPPINTRNYLPKKLIFPTRFRRGRILRAPNVGVTVQVSLQIQRCGFRSPVVSRRTAPRKAVFGVRVMASCAQEA